ncbi:MAG: peroxidase family protein [Rhizobiaceae bacterium]
MIRAAAKWTLIGLLVIVAGGGILFQLTASENDKRVLSACWSMVWAGFRPIEDVERTDRFLGKIDEATAICRGVDDYPLYSATPWVDWSNYWGAGDNSSRTTGGTGFIRSALSRILSVTDHIFDRNTRGLDGVLLDLEYQRMELIRFNLFDNATFPQYVEGRDDNGSKVAGSLLNTWSEMRLAETHPDFDKLKIEANGDQLCDGELIRFRTLTGICNDIRNPAMGSSGQLFARNSAFESTFPRLEKNELTANRHGGRLSLLKPDPQVISRKLFTRPQAPDSNCNAGIGDGSFAADCDYTKASFFNVLAAFWIQFMTHDWFSHMDDARNDKNILVGEAENSPGLGCNVSGIEQSELGCRLEDKMERSLYASQDDPNVFGADARIGRAYKTTRNTVTAWWDASQIYGHDRRSGNRVARDPGDMAKLQMIANDAISSDNGGYLPLFQNRCEDDEAQTDCSPIHPEWIGQEATAFPDNWSIGLSFYHNVFTREHNAFVDAFREHAAKFPQSDSGMRDPREPDKIITYGELASEENAGQLFEVARLVVSALIAKIHTIEWTTQLLYNDPLFKGMNSNWSGLFEDHPIPQDVSARLLRSLADSDDPVEANLFYSAFNAGPGIIGTGSNRHPFPAFLSRAMGWDDWSIENPDDVNGGTNHFGSPFNFPEEFTSVYRLHPLLPDMLELRDRNDPNKIAEKVPVISTFRANASTAMRGKGLANWALTLGRQRLGALVLQNHPQFLQNLDLRPRLDTKIDVAALDLIRDRERGIPRFNEFRRQIGLKQLTSFDDFIQVKLLKKEKEGTITAAEQGSLDHQRKLVSLMREVYGTHQCDNSKVISIAQSDPKGATLPGHGDVLFPTDCLGHEDGSVVDNIEDLDNVVGWLAETTRPHGFAISETQFHIFILNASRRLFSDRFFTSSYRPEFYTSFGLDWVNNNGPDGKQYEPGLDNGHQIEISPMKRVLLRALPELGAELEPVRNVFDPWARDRGEFYTLAWKPRPGAENDESFAGR